MDPGGRDIQPDGIAADFAGIENGPHGPTNAAEPLPLCPAAHQGPRGRTAMYSKNDSVPPGANRPVSPVKIFSTTTAEKLLNGRPETMTS